jgi:hypothetical protein
VSSKKTKRAGKPDAEKRATHSPAEQDLDIAVQSRRPNQITYPFDSPHILEKQVIPWLCSVVYSGEYLAGGNKRSGALKRVRSRIRYARSIGALEPATRRTLETAPFFEWALRQKDWEELNNVRRLAKGVVAFVEGTQAEAKVGLSTLAYPVPDTYEELLEEYLLAIRELREAELEIERLADENKYLSAQLATKAEKSRQASEHGKKGAGIPREKKGFT